MIANTKTQECIQYLSGQAPCWPLGIPQTTGVDCKGCVSSLKEIMPSLAADLSSRFQSHAQKHDPTKQTLARWIQELDHPLYSRSQQDQHETK